jgi:hypothetical protein
VLDLEGEHRRCDIHQTGLVPQRPRPEGDGHAAHYGNVGVGVAGLPEVGV